MHPILRWTLRIGASLLVFTIALSGWLYYIQGRPIGKRPDLVRLPADAPPAPRGFPTTNAMMLNYLLGRIELLSLDDVPLLQGVREYKGLTYSNAADQDLKLDLHLPEEGEGPYPLLIFIHGGGWSKGSRDDYHYYTMRFALRGYAVATVSYRLSPKFRFPAAVEDVKCALGWLQANSATYDIDPEKAIVVGGSAGGYLSLMAGLTDREAYCGDCETPPRTRPIGIINLYGPTDLTAPVAQTAPEVTGFLGVSWEEAPERFEEASPLAHLTADDPPIMTIHGTLDQTVPVAQADALVEQLQVLGATYWYDRLDGFPHTMDLTPPVNERIQWMIQAFAQKVLAAQPSSTADEQAQTEDNADQ